MLSNADRYKTEKPKYAALDILLDTLPPDQRENAGHALSLLINRLTGDGSDGVARATDTKMHLGNLEVLFRKIADELQEAALRAPDKTEEIAVDSGVVNVVLRKRVLAALEAGDKTTDVRVRQSDLGGQGDFGALRAFLRRTTNLPSDTIDFNKKPEA